MAGGGSYKILIVEDNEMNMALVGEILSMKSYETLEAENGREGVEMALEFLPDLILMDINLPEMDGITAMKKIKSDKISCHIPIIALTASAMKGDEDKLVEQGFDGYVGKPVNVKSLLEEVDKTLKGITAS